MGKTRLSAYAVPRSGIAEVHLFGRKSAGPETARTCLLMVEEIPAAHDAVAKRFHGQPGSLSHSGGQRLPNKGGACAMRICFGSRKSADAWAAITKAEQRASPDEANPALSS